MMTVIGSIAFSVLAAATIAAATSSPDGPSSSLVMLRSSPSTMVTCHVVPPSLDLWTYAIAVHTFFCLAVACPMGILLYLLRTKRTQPQPQEGKQQEQPQENTDEKSTWTVDTIVAVSLGLGAAICVPLLRPIVQSYSPNEDATWIGPFLASTFGFATFFKCINVAFDQIPKGANQNIVSWLLWFVVIPEPEFNNNGTLRQQTTSEILNTILATFGKIVGLSAVLTLLVNQIVNPDHPLFTNDETYNSTMAILASLLNGYILTWLIYLFASFCLDFSKLGCLVVSGGRTAFQSGFLNPLLQSRSLTEAWGQRWNLPVQVLLKRTVYIPARQRNWSRSMSAMLTFFVAGLLHEYNFFVHNSTGYEPCDATMFFLLMGCLMVLEQLVWTTMLPQPMKDFINQLPSPIISFVVTFLISGMVEHFFVRSWLRSGFVEAAAQMFPHMQCQST